jgi:D-alanyl-D-alanine dipeptidase
MVSRVECQSIQAKRIANLLLEKEMIKAGMVNISTVDTSIKIDMIYASERNFLHLNFYKNFKKAYLQKEVAEKLSLAQQYLKNEHPDFSLIVYDAARPAVFQQLLWDSLPLPWSEKIKYVSNPVTGSLHNFGAAVDVSIIDSTGNVLDMGSPIDSTGEISHPVMEWKFLENGRLNKQQIENRKLLRKVMYQAGFFNIQTEWWHFNACTRAYAIEKYRKI